MKTINMPKRFVEFASSWYDSSGSMLYAVASTGNLTIGNRRPYDCDTDEEWFLSLWVKLRDELRLIRPTINPASIINERDTNNCESFIAFVDSVINKIS
jgi:hypothetical protein